MKHLTPLFSVFFRKAGLITLAICSLLISATPASAQLVVTSNADSGAGSLREVISIANTGDTIRFAITGTLVLKTEIVIGKNLHIQGPGASELAISGQDSTRIFVLTATDTVRLSSLTIRNGSAAYASIPAGGAISNEGFLAIDSCVFHHNQAVSGGAIENVGGMGGNVRLELSHCTFYNNYATLASLLPILKAGGAITSNGRQGGSARIFANNCTFSGNQSGQSGGAIFLIGDPTGGVSFEGTNCTITQNIANGGGGIDNAQAEAVFLKNSLLAGNFGKVIQPDMFGALISRGYNVIGDTGSINYQGMPTDIINVDARIGPLADNGNGLPTHSLMCGSPAIDAGDDATAPTRDQRGQLRIGTSDIGAFERNDVLDILVTNVRDAGAGSLRQALILACPGEVLDLSSVSGTLSLTTPLEIFQDVSIQGNPTLPLRLDGNNSTRILEIAAGATTNLSWLSFVRGYSDLFGGGAIQNRGNTTIEYCTFANNRAVSGGAIANYGDGAEASLQLSNCSFAFNAATLLDGGAIDNRAYSHLAATQLLNCTLASNAAENKGGALYNSENAMLEFRNTLIGFNDAPQGSSLFDEATEGLVSLGHNLISDHDASIYTADTTDILNQDPLLAPLSYYGGPTTTFLLYPGSPAIDAGDNSNVGPLDQRGESRIFNSTVDIGAYEYDPATRIDEVGSRPLLRFYPNPASQQLFILPEGGFGAARIALFSGQRQVFEQVVPFPNGDMPMEISLPVLPPGFYLIRYSDGQTVRYGKLMIR